MLWLVYTLASVFLITVYALLARVLTVKSENPRAFSVLFGVFAAFFSLFLFIFDPMTWKPVPFSILLLTFLATVLYGIHDRTQFYASKHVEASMLVIIFQITPIVGFITSLLFLHEAFTWEKFFGVLLIIAGNLFVLHKNPHFKFDKGLVYALIAGVALGFVIVVNKRASTGYSLPFYNALVFFFPAVYNFFFPRLSWGLIKKEFTIARWKIIILSLISLLEFYFILKALQLADASKVIPVSSSEPILVVLAGIIILHEKSHLWKKIIAGFLVFAGVVLISL